jgi:hypothetical protein
MVTQRAVLFGFVGFCFYLIAIVNSLPPFYYALSWLTAGLLVSCWGVALLSLLGLDCRWTLPEISVAESLETPRSHVVPNSQTEAAGSYEEFVAGHMGRDIADGPGIEIEFYNGGTWNKTDIVVEVRLRSQRDQSLLMRRFLIEAVPSGGRVVTTLPLFDLSRGRYQIEQLRLVGSDVLGLFRMRRRVAPVLEAESATDATSGIPPSGIPVSETSSAREQNAVDADTQKGTITIGPAMLAVPGSLAGWHRGGASGGASAVATLGQGDELRGTRPYVAGDDLRFVHWKSTARRGELVVREFHNTAQPQCVVIWDGNGRLDSEGKGEAGSEARARALVPPAAFEWSLRLAASLCRTLVECGQPCALLKLDDQPVWIPPAGRGVGSTATLARITQTLADAAPRQESEFGAAVAPWLRRLGAGTPVLWVSCRQPENVEAWRQNLQLLRAQRLYVTACLVDVGQFVASSKIRDGAPGRDGAPSKVPDSEKTGWSFSAGNTAYDGGRVIWTPQRTLTPRSARGAGHAADEAGAQALRLALNEILHGMKAMANSDQSFPVRANATQTAVVSRNSD